MGRGKEEEKHDGRRIEKGRSYTKTNRNPINNSKNSQNPDHLYKSKNSNNLRKSSKISLLSSKSSSFYNPHIPN